MIHQRLVVALTGTFDGARFGLAPVRQGPGKAENLAKMGSRTARFLRAELIEITRFASKNAIRLVLAYRIGP
jgi:hypothetical protein